MIVALEQLCDTFAEMLDKCEGAAPIVNETEKFEYVAVLVFWS